MLGLSTQPEPAKRSENKLYPPNRRISLGLSLAAPAEESHAPNAEDSLPTWTTSERFPWTAPSLVPAGTQVRHVTPGGQQRDDAVRFRRGMTFNEKHT